ncbi:hypothetical protein BCR35DRAFT_54024 [Leucosporidium creatinivorum]|uniref:Uncharacterized protein n=1 Tax=Leucosporidium creatinivorum TaxID=106004 RepID=A0A1Y2FN07_9BASI|nr:hypothetical protein BCR35DRAFT_54024 [Leucosporidium creatinivorum]
MSSRSSLQKRYRPRCRVESLTRPPFPSPSFFILTALNTTHPNSLPSTLLQYPSLIPGFPSCTLFPHFLVARSLRREVAQADLNVRHEELLELL